MANVVGKKIQVGKGFVSVIATMGTDDAIARAARVSYGKSRQKKTREENERLIRYLMRHGHTSPFEMCEIKFHVKVPMDIWRQWVRHRTASINEHSTRYTKAILEADDTVFRLPGKDSTLLSPVCREKEARVQELAFDTYEDLLTLGAPKEQARRVLPLSTFTEAIWKIDLHNLLKFLKLRLDKTAQSEFRDYAEAIAEIVKSWCPVTWGAFEDYALGAVTFSLRDMQALRGLVELSPGEHEELNTKIIVFEQMTGLEVYGEDITRIEIKSTRVR